MVLSIIIVSHNSREYLDDCIRAIKSNISVQHEIIVVDNASTDGGADFVRMQHHDVRLVTSDVNRGFAGGNNLGASVAQGKYLLLLNHDTKLISDIHGAVELLEKNDGLGVIGAKMMGRGGEYRFSAGHFPSPVRLLKISTLYKKGGHFRSGEFPSRSKRMYYPVDWVEGSFLLTRKDLWNNLGGMDENYFMYGEDVDYCKRVHDAGFTTVYVPTIRYVHYGGYTVGRFAFILHGFRRYHDKFSGKTTRVMVFCILKAGVTMRRWYYWLRFLFNNRTEYREILEVLSRIRL